MAIIRTSTVNANSYFNLDGVDYQKGIWQLVYNTVERSNDVIDEDIIQVGIKEINSDHYLQTPIPVVKWRNGDASNASFADRDALITALATLVGFNTASGGSGARSQTVLSGSPFTDRAALNTFSGSNLDQLHNSDTQVAVATVTDEAVYFWAGEDTPTSYTDSWVVLVRLDAMMGNVTQGTIPIQGMLGLEDSSIRETSTQIITTKSLVTPDASVAIGNWQVSNGGFTIELTELASGRVFYPIGTELESSGTTAPFYWSLGDEVITPAAADISETFTGSSIQFIAPSVNSGIATRYTFNSVTEVNNVNLVIRLGSHSSETPIFDYERATGNRFSFTSGENPLMLPVALFFEAGTELYVTIESSTGDLSLRGQTVNGETFPYVEVFGRLATKFNMATEQFVTDAIANIPQPPVTPVTPDVDGDVILFSDTDAWDASSGSFPVGAQEGHLYTISAGGTVDGQTFTPLDLLLATTDGASTSTFAGNWHKIDSTVGVQSLLGRTGNIASSDFRRILTEAGVSLAALTRINAGEGINVDTSGNLQQPTISNTGVIDIVAGTNVTLDKTDPRRPIINSTGGGGGGATTAAQVSNSNTNQNGLLATATNQQIVNDRIDATGLGASARTITGSFNAIWFVDSNGVQSENTMTWFGNRQNVIIEVRPTSNGQYTFRMPDLNDTNSMFDALNALGLGEEYTLTLVYLGGNTGFVNRNRLTINNASVSIGFPTGTFPTVLAQGQSATFRVRRNAQWERIAFEQAINPAPTLGEFVFQNTGWNNADNSFLPSGESVLRGYAFPVVGSNPNDGTLRQGLLDAGVTDRIIYDGDYVVWTAETFTSWINNNGADWFVLPRNQLQEISRAESNFLSQVTEVDNRVDIAPVSMLTNDALVWLSENPLAEAPFLSPSTDTNNPRTGDNYPYVGGRENRNGMNQFQLGTNRFNNYITIGITPNFITGHNLRDIEIRIVDTDRNVLNTFNLQDDFTLVDDATFSNSTVTHYQRNTSINYPFLATIEIWLTQVQEHFLLDRNTVNVTQNIPVNAISEQQLSSTVQEKLNRAIPPQGVTYASIQDRLSPYANVVSRTPAQDARYFASDGTETYPSGFNDFVPVPANNPVFQATETILFIAVPEPGSFILKNLTASTEVALDGSTPNIEVVQSFTNNGITYFVYRITGLTVGNRFEVERVETHQVVAWQNEIDNLEADVDKIEAQLEHAVFDLPDEVVQVLEHEVTVTEESTPNIVPTDYNRQLAGSSNTSQTVFYEPSPVAPSAGIKSSQPLSALAGDQVRQKLLFIPPSTPANQASYITAFDGTTGRDLISFIQGEYLVNVRVPAQPASTVTSTIYPATATNVSGAGIWQTIPALTFVNGVPVPEADEVFFTRNIPSSATALTIQYRGHANGNIFGAGTTTLNGVGGASDVITTFNINDGSEIATVEVRYTASSRSIRVSVTERVNTGLPTINDVQVILSYTESRTIPSTPATTRQVSIGNVSEDWKVFTFKAGSNGNLFVVSDQTEIDTNRTYETWFGSSLGGHISVVNENATFLNFEDFEPIVSTVVDFENHATLSQFGLFTTQYTHATIVELGTQLIVHDSMGNRFNIGDALRILGATPL